jgi:hypothetical protein
MIGSETVVWRAAEYDEKDQALIDTLVVIISDYSGR